MKTLSMSKLAKTVKILRDKKGMSQVELGKITGINRLMIGRIESQNFIPSINQLQELADVLQFDITEMFVTKSEPNSFIALRSEDMSDSEKEGVEKLFTMMLSIRQQILLRRKYENERKQHA